MINTVVLLTGSNAGNREGMLGNATRILEKNGVKISAASSVYETAAWGKEDQPDFLNQVLITRTDHTPVQMLNLILETEKEMGRMRNEKWEQRCIDIDILFFNNEILHESGLKIPHEHLHARRFTLVPLNELIPEYVHPVLKKTIRHLLNECADTKEVKLKSRSTD